MDTTFLKLSHNTKMFNYPSIKISMQNLRRTKEAVKQSDIVFVQELAPVGMMALHYAKKFHKKVILYVHNTPWEFVEKYFLIWNPLIKLAMKKFFVHYYNQADLLLIPYHNFEQQLRQAGVKAPTEVARLGVDIGRFQTKSKQRSKEKLHLSGRTVIGYVGRISNEKNTLVLLEAFKKMRSPKVTLLMVGDGSPELVKKFKQTPNCIVTGFVRNVEDYLSAMDIFVMPSLTETTSLATLEAMSCGVAVITTKVGFMQEYITKGYNGIFFPRSNPFILASKMEYLWRHPLLREKLGQNARKTISYSFSWERSIAHIKHLLNRNI